jgi:hypothetical protein
MRGANTATRTFAVVALVSAALFGLWARWEGAQGNRLVAPATPRSALVGLRLNDGAVVDEIVSEAGDDGVRLRLADCADPAFLFPLPIGWVSTAESLDRSFAPSGYKAIQIYRDKIQYDNSRMNLIYEYVLARIAAMGSAKIADADRLYVQIYIGAHCHVDQGVLVDWANTVLGNWL